MSKALAERINGQDFDHVFILHADGTIEDTPNVWAPSVTHDESADILIDGVPYRDSDTWDALTGLTGQHSYHGAVMHSSEFIGESVARVMLDMCADGPRTFVVTVVDVDDDDEDDPEPAGWAILVKR
jgi:hypothetical protein